MYNDPFNTYFRADDERVYASKRELVVTSSDPEYMEWIANGMIPAMWPRDAAGNQTDASLQAVLTPRKQFVNLEQYTAYARRARIADDIYVNDIRFSTDPLTFGSLNSAYIYTQSNNGATFSWKLPDGGFVTLSKADTDALQATANEFAQNCFKCEDETLTKIEAGTITTREQVDAEFAAVSNTFTGLTADAQKVRHRPRATKKK